MKLSFFEAKNLRWIDHGVALGGCISVNMRQGSVDGPAHFMSETLIIGAWEPLRRDRDAGRVVFGMAHDHTLGKQTTRELADRLGLVETADDLDTSPDQTFTTLGLLAWENEIRTATDRGWGYRVGQLSSPATSASRSTSTTTASSSWPATWTGPTRRR